MYAYNCLECNKVFYHAKKNIKFCGHKCSAVNRVRNRTYDVNRCVICNTKTDGKYCRRCYNNITKFSFYRSLLTRKIGEYVSTSTSEKYYGKFGIKSNIGRIARKLWDYMGYPNHCEACGYSKHVELAHVIPSREFNDDSLMCHVNSPSNLVALCPNCHFEFDHNTMTEGSIEKIKIAIQSRQKPYLNKE